MKINWYLPLEEIGKTPSYLIKHFELQNPTTSQLYELRNSETLFLRLGNCKMFGRVAQFLKEWHHEGGMSGSNWVLSLVPITLETENGGGG